MGRIFYFIKKLFEPRFIDMPCARKKCSKCGCMFSQWQRSQGDSHHFFGPVWYEPTGSFKAAPGCDCEKIMKRGRPRFSDDAEKRI